MDKFNYTMLCDFYELTMGNGYFVSGMQEKISYFDLFFRQIPDGGGFAIACGLEQVINYIENLHFDEEDIEFLRSKGIFDEGFLKYLKDFRFTGDIFAVPVALKPKSWSVIVQAVPEQPPMPAALAPSMAASALSQTSFSALMQQAQWHIHGCRCLTASWRLSRHTASAIQRALFCLWTLIMCHCACCIKAEKLVCDSAGCA